jgi:hypothetical protein
VFPRDFFLDYWNPALRDELFVAMPFEQRFDPIWTQAVLPAAQECGLSANRVDTRLVSDSILVDILDGIAHARLIVVDVSPVSCPPCHGILDRFRSASSIPRYPNGNVMYELGLAHATRQAEEVVVVRDNADHPLLFDMSGVRVHSYPADDPAAAKALMLTLFRDALRAVNQSKALQISRAIQAVSLRDVRLIRRWWPHPFKMYSKNPDGDLGGLPSDMAESVSDLQRLGMLRVHSFPVEDACAVNLVWTEFGNAVVRAMPPAILAGRRDPLAVDDVVPDEVTAGAEGEVAEERPEA